jgi:cyclase
VNGLCCRWRSGATTFAVWLLCMVVVSTAFAQPFPEPRTVRINARVHVLLGPVQHANPVNQGYMINSTVIVGDNGVLLIDSGGTDAVGRHIAAAVRRITDKTVTHVINTHHHGDHHLGNVAFEGASFFSSELCRKMVLETGHEWVATMERDIGRKLPGTSPRAADVTYPTGARTEAVINGIRVVLWVPPASHTIGDLMVLLPEDNVLIAGDILVKGVVPTLQDGYLKNWISTLDQILALSSVDQYVPGHGDLMDRAEVGALRATLGRFHSAISEGVRQGRSEVDLRKSVDVSAWEKLERAYVIGRNINRAYLEVEADSFDSETHTVR